MSLRTAPITILIALALTALGASSAAAAPAFSGKFPVAGLGTNNKIVEGPDGNMWVTVAARGNGVARINPVSGEVKEFKVGAIVAPSGIAKGPEGKLWVTFAGGVASFSPSSPETAVDTAIPAIKDESSIVAGPDGNMWVASPVPGDGEVIKFSPATPALAVSVPVSPELVPHDIDVAGSLIVIASAGGNPRIVTLTTAGVEKDYKLEGASQGVAGTKSGLIGYSEPQGTPERVGLIAPPTAAPGIVLPGGGDPFGVALGSDEAFWIALSAAGKDGVERLTSSGQITFFGGLENNSMARQIASGPGNTMWVTITKNESEAVARISGLEPPVTNTPPPPTEPQTKLGKGPKGVVKTKGKVAMVKFAFSSTTAGASFECRLNKLTKKKKAKSSKVAKFAGCRSPKIYKLKPGRYRFEVRAVAAGLTDKSPAKSSFKVVHVAPRHHR